MILFQEFRQRRQCWLLLRSVRIPVCGPFYFSPRHDGLGFFPLHPGLQPNEDHEHWIPRRRRIDLVGQRPKHLRPQAGRQALIVPQHANDSASLSAHDDLLPKHIRRPGEMRLPEIVADHHHLVSSVHILTREKAAAERRHDSEHRQEICRDIEAVGANRRTGYRDINLSAGGQSMFTEYTTKLPVNADLCVDAGSV